MDSEKLTVADKVAEYASKIKVIPNMSRSNKALFMCGEMGKLMEAIAKHDDEKSKSHLTDVFISAIILSELMGFNIEKSVEEELNKLNEVQKK